MSRRAGGQRRRRPVEDAVAPGGVPPGPARTVPAVAPPGPLVLPRVTEVELGNGLRVLAVRRPGIPLASLRVVLPTARPRVGAAERARLQLLGRTLLAGTSRRTSQELAEHLQRLGGGLGAAADAEDLSLSGSSLDRSMPDLLDTALEVLTDATFPADEVATERARTTQELALARSQPATLARLALLRRVFGRHPYADPLPDAADVAKVQPAQLARHVRTRVGPAGGVAVLVADRPPSRLVAELERTLGTWSSPAASEGLGPPPPPRPGPVVVVDRPGAVQSNIRMAAPAPTRRDDDLPDLALSVTAFGGYFSSRLVANLREDKGWTYSPGAGVEHFQACSLLVVSADVATEVTAPAMVEILHELGRMATLPLEAGELDAAARYRAGTIALSVQTQAGLASQLAVLASHGLGPAYLRSLPQRYARVTTASAFEAARRWLAPARFATVVVGDAERVVPQLEALGPVEVRFAP